MLMAFSSGIFGVELRNDYDDGFWPWHAWLWYGWVLPLTCRALWPCSTTEVKKKKCFVPSRPLLGDGKWWKNCVLIHFLGSNGSKNMCLMCSVFKGPNIWRWSPFVDFLPGLLRGEKQTNMCSMRYSFKGSTTWWWSPFFRKMAVGKRCLLDSDDETNVQNKVG